MIKEVTLTNDDYKAFCKVAFERQSTANKEEKEKEKENGFKLFFMNLLVWIVVAVVILLILQSKEFSLSKFHWPTALLTSVPFLVIIAAYISYLKGMAKNTLAKENGPMLGKRIIEIDESGIKDTNSFCSSIYKWEALEEVVIHEGSVYLFLDTMLAQIIPSSAFESQAEVQEFTREVEKMHKNIVQPTASVSAE